MRILADLPVGLRVGLAIAFLAISALGWIWTASQAAGAPVNLILAAALLLLVLGGVLILSLASGGNALADLLGRWPAQDAGVRLPGRLQQALQQLNGQWRAQQDRQQALEARIAELEAELNRVRSADSAVLDEMARLCGAIGSGVLHQRVTGSAEEAGHNLTERFNQMAETLDAVVGELKALFARMAEGDLSAGMHTDYGGDFAVIRDAAEQAIERLGNVMGTIVEAANTISGATVELTREAKGLADSAQAQSENLDRTAADAASLSEAAQANEAAAKRANQRAEEARAAAENGVNVVNRSIEAMNEMAAMSQRISEITSLINEIAFQTNLLALNASVEAARAGEAGKGFAVVAQEVRALAQRSANASKDIGAIIKQSNDKVKSGVTLVSETGTVLSRIVEAIDSMGQQLGEIGQASTDQTGRVSMVSQAISEMNAATRGYLSVVQRTGKAIQDIDAQVGNLANQIAFITTPADRPFLLAAQEAAAQISAAFEAAIDRGEMSLEDFFDENYVPIQGTNPQQFMTRFVKFTDSFLPKIQEPLLESIPGVAFCAAVDRNGFLPTHNLKYCQPQGKDPVWNAANSRNRRMFNDPVGLACGRNTNPYLLQCYRRDMGGGVFILMKDMSAPITIRGRHWGGFRIGYKT
ncbi:MAG TPA: methyl-accepting chemotaxis protein [Ferrovibrio sp.]|jgi:methyl-accepting chemotaxis protein|uniref:methyl-accepting chemotaxis protein n=1 Tax=Ferrovibrio sp. TaxID=1917215 RepID=UPI002B4B267F|nr:methyl-accepting chemotaxis protein [Ferrovibrio sp.]HLT78970.1 methyl-accepting chemotaxis protein [Ferrovibrio sp.]